MQERRSGWTRPQSGFTLLFEALAMALLSEMPVNAAAELVGEHDTRHRRVLHHYVARARSRTCYAGVTTVGIDETSAARGHDYITLFCDLDRPRVVYATEDRNQATVRRFAHDLAAHGGDPRSVQEVCCDMSPAFIRGIADHLPAAEITFDRYHLAQQLGQALDQVRREEVRSRPELRGTRYLWLKRPAKLKPGQAAQLAFLTARHRGLRTARAYGWRLTFDAFFDQPRERAEPYLERWYQGAVRSRLAPLQNFAYLIDEHWQGVLRWHQTRISNGLLEAPPRRTCSTRLETRTWSTSTSRIRTKRYGCGGTRPSSRLSCGPRAPTRENLSTTSSGSAICTFGRRSAGATPSVRRRFRSRRTRRLVICRKSRPPNPSSLLSRASSLVWFGRKEFTPATCLESRVERPLPTMFRTTIWLANEHRR